MGLTVLGVALSSGCAVGPDYTRPAVDVPSTYRTAGTGVPPRTGTNTFADLEWWSVFQDPQLSAYIGDALSNNWDIGGYPTPFPLY